MNDNNMFVIGKIVNTHGIRGELKIVPFTDDIKRFDLLKSIFVEKKSTLTEYKIMGIRYHKKFILMLLEGINDMTAAESLKGCELKIPEDEAVECGEDEYFIRDIYDLNVVTEDGESLGKITDIIFTGANDVYTVKNDDGKELLIPAIKQCIKKVDIENGIMTVKLLEGLR